MPEFRPVWEEETLAPNIAEEFKPDLAAMSGQAAEPKAEPFKPPFEIGAPEPIALPPTGYKRPAEPEQVPDQAEVVEEPPPVEPTPLPIDTLDESDVRADSLAYQALGQSRTQLTTQLGHLDAQIATAATSEERQALIAQRQELGQSLQSVTAAQQEAGTRAETGMARIEERAISGQADARLAQAQEVEQGTRLAQEQSLARQAKLQEREDIARDQVVTDQDKYRQLLNRGPKATAVISTLASITSEVFKATLENRVADFGAIAATAWQRDRQAFSDERSAAGAAIKLSGDAVRDVAAQRDAVEAEEAAQKAAVLEGASQRAQLAISQATNDRDKAHAGMVYKGIQEQHEIATAKASSARFEQFQKAEKRALDAEYKRAQIAKLGADTAKTEAERQKLARRGSGRRKLIGALPGELRDAVRLGRLSEKGAKTVFSQGIIDPATGEYMRRGDGSFAVATNSKNATTLNEAVALSATANGLINEALAMRGGAGWEPTSKWYASESGKRMAALSTQLLLLNKDVYQLGVLSESDERLLERIQGGDLAGLQDPRPALRDMQRRGESALNTRLRSLVPGASKLSFKRVREAARPTQKSLETRLTQAPRMGSNKIVPTARERMADVEQMRELAISESGGDVAEAASAFTNRMAPILKRGKAHKEDLLTEVRKATPVGYDAAQLKMIVAGGNYAGLQADDSTAGRDLEDAAKALAKAQADVKRLETPRFRKLLDAQEEQRVYLRDAAAMTTKDVAALRNKEATDRAEAERAGEEFEAGRVGSGGKIGAF